MSSKIWLSPPNMGDAEMRYIADAFNKNWIAPMGENVDGFEQDLEKIFPTKKVVALNSGTSAIHLGLKLLGVTTNDYVLCQTSTFVASVNPVLYLGAIPVFIDSEMESYNISPFFLETAIVDLHNKGIKPKAMVVGNSYGMPHQHDEILAISCKYQIPILEDAASSLGSSYKHKPCGTLGTVGVISFNGNKIITTSAGGALICQSAEEKKQIISWATQAKQEGVSFYNHLELGYNYRLSNILAGIGRGQLLRLQLHLENKRKVHNQYQKLFKDSSVSLVQEYSPDVKSNFWLNCILIKDQHFLNELINLMSRNNIEVRRVWKPLHMQDLFKKYDYYGLEVAENLFNQGLCLPSGSSLTTDDLNKISNVFNVLEKVNA